MTKGHTMMKRLRADDIEQLTAQRIKEFEQTTDEAISDHCIPIERIIENEPFDLSITYEPIEEHPGETILGALRPERKQIIVNENRLEMLEKHTGLERFTLGHELGHYDLFASAEPPMPSLFAKEDTNQIHAYRDAKEGIVSVLKELTADKREMYEVWRALNQTRRQDSAREKWAVDRYSGSLLMPRDRVMNAVKGLDLTQWPTIYDLAREFKVSPTAFRVRLEILGLVFYKNEKLFPSREEYAGQLALDM